jgi:hypothetical protein
MNRPFLITFFGLAVIGVGSASANPPIASYIFPAGGQRGKTVAVRVGGLFLHQQCSFDIAGPGLKSASQLQRTAPIWFEGPLLPLPQSQQAEDYPRDMAGEMRIDSDAPLGAHSWRVWTSQGASSGPVHFVVGDLPEVIEQEKDGDPVPTEVKLPVTINGRIFPRENVDSWVFEARQGQTITCEVNAARIGSPLDSRLEVLDPKGKRIAENDDAFGADSMVRFTAAADGKHQVRIHDVQMRGGPAFVYRLTLTADPYVDRVYPLGGRRGGKATVELSGQGLAARPVEISIPSTAPAEYSHRLNVGGKQTNPNLLDVDDLPEYIAPESNNQVGEVKPIAVPAVLNGRISKPGHLDDWAFSGVKGQVYRLDLRAQVLGSPLVGVMAIRDASGKELMRSEVLGQGKVDPFLQFTAPADATYWVRVAEAFHSRGGPAYAYRLRITKAGVGDFRLRLADSVVTVTRGGQGKLRVSVEPPVGAAIRLSVEGLPSGVTAAETQIGPNQPSGEITFKGDATARIQGTRVSVRGTAKIGQCDVSRLATFSGARGAVDVDTVVVVVGLATPFKIIGKYDMRWAARGGVAHRHYQIDRGGFQGALEVTIADRQARHLQGVTGSALTVPAGATEFDYAIQLPPWMEMGRTCRVCVMATGVVQEADGSKHTVSFSSIQPNEQFIFVVEPGKLDIETERTSYLAVPGKTMAIPVRVTRGKSLEGSVKVELIKAAHLGEIQAEPVTIPAGKSQGELTIHFGPALKGPIDMPFVIRATLTDKGEPIVAETKVDIQTKD